MRGREKLTAKSLDELRTHLATKADTQGLALSLKSIADGATVDILTVASIYFDSNTFEKQLQGINITWNRGIFFKDDLPTPSDADREKVWNHVLSKHVQLMLKDLKDALGEKDVNSVLADAANNVRNQKILALYRIFSNEDFKKYPGFNKRILDIMQPKRGADNKLFEETLRKSAQLIARYRVKENKAAIDKAFELETKKLPWLKGLLGESSDTLEKLSVLRFSHGAELSENLINLQMGGQTNEAGEGAAAATTETTKNTSNTNFLTADAIRAAIPVNTDPYLKTAKLLVNDWVTKNLTKLLGEEKLKTIPKEDLWGVGAAIYGSVENLFHEMGSNGIPFAPQDIETSFSLSGKEALQPIITQGKIALANQKAEIFLNGKIQQNDLSFLKQHNLLLTIAANFNDYITMTGRDILGQIPAVAESKIESTKINEQIVKFKALLNDRDQAISLTNIHSQLKTLYGKEVLATIFGITNKVGYHDNQKNSFRLVTLYQQAFPDQDVSVEKTILAAQNHGPNGIIFNPNEVEKSLHAQLKQFEGAFTELTRQFHQTQADNRRAISQKIEALSSQYHPSLVRLALAQKLGHQIPSSLQAIKIPDETQDAVNTAIGSIIQKPAQKPSDAAGLAAHGIMKPSSRNDLKDEEMKPIKTAKSGRAAAAHAKKIK